MGLISEAVKLATRVGGSIARSDVLSATRSYEEYHSSYGGDEEERKANYRDMVDKYYDLSTSFYEYGWGQSFHFADRYDGETLRESIKRHEHYLALQLGLTPGMKVLDVGCGIGGPMREIATFSGASITGLNINAYQIARGTELNKKVGLDKRCDFLQADFMNIPIPDNSYDAVYTIAASCHAPDAVACYKEMHRVLKPGQLFAGQEWCLTESYDSENAEHRKVKEVIELGNSLPDVRTKKQCLNALKAAGFEVLIEKDLAETSPLPWYSPLDSSQVSFGNFHLTTLGRFLLRNLVPLLEFIGLAPKGSQRVHCFLEKAAEALATGGREKIFTAVYFFVARKPMYES